VVAVSLGDSSNVDIITGSQGSGGSHFYPHAGHIIATSAFQYAGYLDAKLYSKYAWIEFLRNKYHTIAALNAAWKTASPGTARGFYTSFDDAGGFGTGTGVIDEDGRHTAWFGKDWISQAGMTPALKVDLDQFLYLYVVRVYSVQAATIRSYDPNHLLVCGTFGGVGDFGIRTPVAQGLRDGGCQIMVVSWQSDSPQTAIATNQQAYKDNGLPQMVWYGGTANADSTQRGHPGAAYADRPTQAARGQQYAVDLKLIWQQPQVVGVAVWGYSDKPPEGLNYGLVTAPGDNAYDGKCAVRAPSADQWGYPCGGEAGDYGDFLSAVTAANRATDQPRVTAKPPGLGQLYIVLQHAAIVQYTWKLLAPFRLLLK
jgi:hypothetical protein